MVFRAVQLGKNGRTVTEVKNNFHYALGHDVFIFKRSEVINLPDRMYYILKTGFLGYVMVTVQITRQLIMDTILFVYNCYRFFVFVLLDV